MDEKYPALRYSDNMWEDSKNGVLTVECNFWKEFNRKIKEFLLGDWSASWIEDTLS